MLSTFGGFIDRDGEKGIFQINDSIPDTMGCINLLKQWNHISDSSCNWSHHLVKFTITYCHFPRPTSLLNSPDRRAEQGSGGDHQLCIFQVLASGTNLKFVEVLTVFIHFFSWVQWATLCPLLWILYWVDYSSLYPQIIFLRFLSCSFI